VLVVEEGNEPAAAGTLAEIATRTEEIGVYRFWPRIGGGGSKPPG